MVQLATAVCLSRQIQFPDVSCLTRYQTHLVDRRRRAGDAIDRVRSRRRDAADEMADDGRLDDLVEGDDAVRIGDAVGKNKGGFSAQIRS